MYRSECLIFGIFNKMGNLSSGIRREQRLSAIHRLAHDIKMVKLDLKAAKQRRRRAMSASAGIHCIAYAVLFIVLLALFNRTWWESLLFASPIFVFLACIHKCCGCYFDYRLKRNSELLAELKEKKRKQLDVIKNTESYAVTKQLLDEFDKSDNDETPLEV